MCQVSGVTCKVSGVRCHIPGVRVQVSVVTCHVSCVTCCESPVINATATARDPPLDNSHTIYSRIACKDLKVNFFPRAFLGKNCKF